LAHPNPNPNPTPNGHLAAARLYPDEQRPLGWWLALHRASK
jgi:hypothetical protein